MQNSAFGQIGKTEEKVKREKEVMNEENWHLQQQDESGYIPNKLPFYNPVEPKQEQPIIKLKSMSHQQNIADQIKATAQDNECMLVQLPGTLPFEGQTPHDGKGL